MCLAALPAHADLTITTKVVVDKHASVSKEYIKGSQIRVEEGDNPRLVAIRSLSDYTDVRVLDMRNHEYVDVNRVQSGPLVTLARWIARPARQSGKRVEVFSEAVSAGPDRDFFGFKAHHLIRTERRVAETGACGPSSQTHREGWYIPPSELHYPPGLLREGTLFGFVGRRPCVDVVVHHGDSLLPGLAVYESTGSVTREITDLSTAPLPQSLFEIPKSFQQVSSLPGVPAQTWSEALRAQWWQLRWAIGTWFD